MGIDRNASEPSAGGECGSRPDDHAAFDGDTGGDGDRRRAAVEQADGRLDEGERAGDGNVHQRGDDEHAGKLLDERRVRAAADGERHGLERER